MIVDDWHASEHSCRVGTLPVIGRVPRARGGSQKVYECPECKARWVETDYGWTALSVREELL